MSAEIQADNDSGEAVEVELIGGSNGIFDVMLEGQLLFSKFEQQRFPEPGEIKKILANHQS